MEQRSLADTDLQVSKACLGTMTFGSQVDERAAELLVNECLSSGVNFIDTANSYNQGRAERILGNIFRNRRHEVILASKVYYKVGEGPDDKGLSRAAIFKAIDASLLRLRTDYLDIYYMHQPDYETPVEETLDAMDRLVRAGKVRYPAVSNHSAWQICRILWLSEKRGWKPPVISQVMYNVLARDMEQEYVPFAREFQISSIVYNPLAGGLLTGKHGRGGAAAAGTRFDNNRLYLDRYWHDENFRAVEELTAIAAKAGCSLTELALRWVWQQPGADVVILGASRLSQLQENLRAVKGPPLDQGCLEACDAVWKRLRGVFPNYNR